MFLVTNYIDIAVLAILIVVVLISLLFRKLLKSIFTLVITILCIPAGALLSNVLIDKVKNVNIQEISKGLIPLNTSLASMGDYLVNSNETLQDLYQESPAFKDMIESWPDVMSKLILTYVLVIILFFLTKFNKILKPFLIFLVLMKIII